MTDAHAHPGTQAETRVRMERGIRTMLCGVDPPSAEGVIRLAARSALFTPCCALHPWKAARYRPEDMLPFLEMCPVVGETGLDSVWCDTPVSAQTEALLWNLDYAGRTGKPVVLHTKGMEREIARILKRYAVTKIVHWYSCDEPPTDYLDQDCYFTIGPDAPVNAAVRRVIALAPVDRLLVESDGLEAVAWALGRPVRAGELPEALRRTLRIIAEEKGMAVEEVEAATDRNLAGILKT